MILYPAIDLYKGQAVRLEKGRFDKVTVYDSDPVARAKRIRAEGASHLHVVDLEGARDGTTPNLALIEQIVGEAGLFTEVGGGIRSMETAARYLNAGVSRVILGTAAVENEAFLRAALDTWGEHVAVGVDLLDGYVSVRGWEKSSALKAEEFLEKLAKLQVKTVICTDISRDGMLAGSNHDLYKRLNRDYPMDFIASGGVSGMEDIRGLRELGCAGAILGKAWYSGAVTIPEALAAAGESGRQAETDN